MTAGNDTFRIGDIEITRVTEIVFTSFTPDFLLPDSSQQELKELTTFVPAAFTEDHRSLVLSIHSWVVRTPDHLIVIDTGIGNGRKRRIPAFENLNTGYLENLEKAGVDPAKVDYVLCTHIHSDHVGWNTRLQDDQWVPTFPNARYIWSEIEQAVSASPEFRDSLAAGVYEDSVLPIIESGLVEKIGPNGGEVIKGVTFHPTPGHTPGHMSISLTSKGEEAFFSGDVVHSPLQVYKPHWNSAFCEVNNAARHSRLWALEHAAETNALFLPAHFRGSSAGRVSRSGDQFSWSFA